MKFCDKLQKIRKENNITQECLADKLGVSRQAVSKWESGDSYPDTEKLIQISKLFKVSLDELINDNTDINKSSNKKRFNFMETFNIVFEAIRKVWNMFFAMKFWEKVKFLIEMALVILGIYLTAMLANRIILDVIRRIFAFLPSRIFNAIDYLVYTILYIVWLIIGVMVFIRVLKIRYLDYYVIVKDETIASPVVEEPIKELKERKETKVVIRDPADSGSYFFKKIAKIFLFFFKCFCVCLAMPIVLSFIAFIITFVISLTYLFNGIFFNGISIAIFGAICFTYLLIKFIYNVIFNQKINYAKMFIIFITSIALMGVGVGLSFTGINEFETYSEVNEEKHTKEITLNMHDNLIFDEIDNVTQDKILINDDLDNIKITIDTYNYAEPSIFTYNTFNFEDNTYVTYEVANIAINQDGLKTYKRIINDLKHKKINTNNFSSDNYDITKIEISSKNLKKIKENNANFDE